MPAYVKSGRGYRGLDAWTVVNDGAQRFIPGRTVLVVPQSEAPGWRAILAGMTAAGDAIVVPLSGHFGELRVRRLLGVRGLCLSRDEPRDSDECSWAEAKALALSTAHAFGLVGIDR